VFPLYNIRMVARLIVVVTGPPCAGKTTLAKRLAEQLELPLLTKDGVKELLFDSLGWKDREWSKQLSNATYAVMYHFAEMLLAARIAFILESNFRTEQATPRFLELQTSYPFNLLQVVCNTAPATLLARYRFRAETSERHPGHVDQDYLYEFQTPPLDSDHYTLGVGGKVIRFDTGENFQGNVEALVKEIQEWRGTIVQTDLEEIHSSRK